MEDQYALTDSVEELLETNWEDLHSQRLVDSASRHVTEGRFEQARMQLEAAQRLSAGTKGLVELLAITEVSLAAIGRTCPCQSIRHKFPDWYHILKVDEKADVSLIKKRYRQLALLLHPDKNTHVKAEGAFKYISQAYDCLSDKNKRITFNRERSKFFCRRCATSSGAEDSIRAVSDTNSRTSDRHPPSFAQSQATFSEVCRATELAWETARLQTFRRRARARAEAAGSELGSRLWRWNKEFEKLNIRKEERVREKRDIASKARRQVDEARTGLTSRSKGLRTDRSSRHSMQELETDDLPEADMRKVYRNGSDKDSQNQKQRGSHNLDDLLKSLKSEPAVGQKNRSFGRDQAPGYETGYFGSSHRTPLPSTEDIFSFFRNPPSSHPPEAPDCALSKLDSTASLKEEYFPSKKVADLSNFHQTPLSSSKSSPPVVSNGTQCGQALPEKDLSRLDSGSLLKNLDAALADISRSAGNSKLDYTIPKVPQLKKDRRILQEHYLSSGSPLSKPSVHEISLNKLVRDGRTGLETEGIGKVSAEKFTCSVDDGTCSGGPVSFSCPSEVLADNPIMFITPLLRKHGDKVLVAEMGESHAGPQLEVNFQRQFLQMSGSSGASSFQSRTCESGYQSTSNEKSPILQTAIIEDFETSLEARYDSRQGLNPLLSSEMLGKWMNGLTCASKVSYREPQEDRKSCLSETSCSGRKENNSKETRTESWWEMRHHVPSYLSSKPSGTLLPDYGRIWTQVEENSNPQFDPPKVTDPPVTASKVTSSSTTADFSCTPAISLASSTKLSGSEDPPQLSGLRFLQTGRFDRVASYETNSFSSMVSELPQPSNSAQIPSSESRMGRDLQQSSNYSARVSSGFPWLNPLHGENVQINVESSRPEQAENDYNCLDGYNISQNLQNHRQKSDELMVTLERLREEAKSITATLETYSESSRAMKAAPVLQGMYGANTNGLLPNSQSVPPCLTA